VSWTCEHCDPSQSSSTVTFTLQPPFAHAAAIQSVIQMPHYDGESVFTVTLPTLVAASDFTFKGSLSTAHLAVTTSVLANFASLADNRNPTGLTAQFLSQTSGSEVSSANFYTQNGVGIQFVFQPATSVYVVRETSTFTGLTFVAQLLALFGGIATISTFVLAVYHIGRVRLFHGKDETAYVTSLISFNDPKQSSKANEPDVEKPSRTVCSCHCPRCTCCKTWCCKTWCCKSTSNSTVAMSSVAVGTPRA